MLRLESGGQGLWPMVKESKMGIKWEETSLGKAMERGVGTEGNVKDEQGERRVMITNKAFILSIPQVVNGFRKLYAKFSMSRMGGERRSRGTIVINQEMLFSIC